MLKYELYLNDILRAIELIETSIKNKNFNKFKLNRESIDANSMRLQIIGESISKLPKELKEKYKEVSWEKYLQTRNIISHAYFAVSIEIIWKVIKKDIKKLKKSIKQIKQDLEKNGE